VPEVPVLSRLVPIGFGAAIGVLTTALAVLAPVRDGAAPAERFDATPTTTITPLPSDLRTLLPDLRSLDMLLAGDEWPKVLTDAASAADLDRSTGNGNPRLTAALEGAGFLGGASALWVLRSDGPAAGAWLAVYELADDEGAEAVGEALARRAVHGSEIDPGIDDAHGHHLDIADAESFNLHAVRGRLVFRVIATSPDLGRSALSALVGGP
jgi:hypothetical protein